MKKCRTVELGADDTPAAAERQQLLDRIGDLENQLSRWQSKSIQVEKLRRLGSWETDVDTGRVTWSEGTYRIFGLSPDETITVDRALAFYPDPMELEQKANAAICDGLPYDLTIRFISATGQPGWVRNIGQLFVEGGRRRLVGVVEDITAEVEIQNDVRDLAYQDPLTGLPNRRSFQARLASVIDSTRRDFALLLIDLDHFKLINDTHGHPSGDALLKEVSRRIAECLKGADFAARLSGDEFAVLIFGVRNGAKAGQRAETLLQAFRDPLNTHKGDVTTTLSIGVALCSAGVSANELFRRADTALYRAKAMGRNQACLYAIEMLRALEEQAETLAGMRKALSAGELKVHYQLVVDLRTGAVRGLEALVRWDHPRRGLLSPAAFEAALADPVLSAAIDDWVMVRALADMRAWLDSGVNVAAVNVNASSAQLKRPDLVERVLALLAANRLTPDRLKIEVLETTFLGRGAEQVAETVARLADQGIVCPLDDFGMGYASLKHLKEFRVDRLKIDRTFIFHMCAEAFDRGLVKSIIDLGHNLGIRVTAEGVETAEQLAMLRDFGCDCAQGFLIGRPVPAEMIPGAILSWYAEAKTLLDLESPSFTGMGSPNTVGQRRAFGAAKALSGGARSG